MNELKERNRWVQTERYKFESIFIINTYLKSTSNAVFTLTIDFKMDNPISIESSPTYYLYELTPRCFLFSNMEYKMYIIAV